MLNTRSFLISLLVLGVFVALPIRVAHAALSKEQLVDILKVVDERQKNSGDWRALSYIEQKEKGKMDVVYEAVFMRRSQDQKFLIMFNKPKASQGQGYLR